MAARGDPQLAALQAALSERLSRYDALLPGGQDPGRPSAAGPTRAVPTEAGPGNGGADEPRELAAAAVIAAGRELVGHLEGRQRMLHEQPSRRTLTLVHWCGVIALVVAAALVIGLVVGELGDSGLGRRWALLAVPLLAAGAWLARLRLPAGSGAPVILRPGAVLVAAAALTALVAALGSLTGGWPGSWPGVLALGLLGLGVAQLAGASSELPGSRAERRR